MAKKVKKVKTPSMAKTKTVSNPKKSSRSAVAVPVAISTKTRVGPPLVAMSGPGTIRIKRTEFVCSVTNGSTTGFALTASSASTPGFDLNPGSNILFQWLSALAGLFERFQFHALKFRLIPSQPTSTPGRVYMAVDYDYDDLVAQTKGAMMSNRTVQECPVWDVCELVCDPRELHPDMPWKYVSSSSRFSGVEPRTSFSGFLMIGFDTTSTNLLYDLEVSYDVTLSCPVYELPSAFDNSLVGTTPTYVGNLCAVSCNGNNGEFFSGNTVAGICNPVIGCPVLPVACGTGGSTGVPYCYIAGNTAYPSPTAFDCRRAPRNRGWLEMMTTVFKSSVPPTTPLGAAFQNANSVLMAFDAYGNYLGYGSTTGSQWSGPVLVSGSGTTILGYATAAPEGDPTVNGTSLLLSMGVDLLQIARQWTAFAYLVAYIATSAATVGGYSHVPAYRLTL